MFHGHATSLFQVKLLKEMYCSICEHKTCDSCFVPEFSEFVDKAGKLEECILCGQETAYRLADPVSGRLYYVEGGGQLCKSCFERHL